MYMLLPSLTKEFNISLAAQLHEIGHITMVRRVELSPGCVDLVLLGCQDLDLGVVARAARPGRLELALVQVEHYPNLVTRNFFFFPRNGAIAALA